LEHSLAINVEGKGLVRIIGCGHQTIQRIIERVQTLFDEPVYGIIGGLHFPVKGGRIMKGPFNVQHIVGSDNPPWRGLGEKDLRNGIEAIRRLRPKNSFFVPAR
jgi:7,8-dihydropterin-6-yl-methyl-4-(beta-D-ribofuranosyl)aminobenzene 5'-phosphate synthase